MRGIDIFQKPYYREISTMRGRPMRGLPVLISACTLFTVTSRKIAIFISLPV